MKLDDLRELFYKNNNGSYRKRLNEPVCFEVFIDILKISVNKINKHADILFFKDKYENYLKVFNKKNISRRILSELGFFSKTTTNINYYISRGWSKIDAKLLLQNRQHVTLNKEQSERRAKSFSNNYYNGKHKKFVRPSQIEYWINLGFSEEESKIKMNEYYSVLSKKFHDKIKQEGKKFLTVRQLDFWISQGLSFEEAQEQLRYIQDKRSLNYFIQKYGIEKGTKKFNETIKKWLNTLDNKTEEEKRQILIKKTKYSKRYSHISVKLFENVLRCLEKEGIFFKKIYYKENEYFIYDNENKKIYFYDLTIKDINLIVEFNGNAFHPNKDKLTEIEWNAWINPLTKKTADENYKYDCAKRRLAENNGFNYLIIWEDETFENNKHKIINKIHSLL